MTTVIPFKTQEQLEREEDNQTVIAALGIALEAAKEGKIRSVAISMVREDGTSSSLWSHCEPVSLVGSLEFTKARLLEEGLIDEEFDEI